MDIKNIAKKLAPGYWTRDQWNIEYFDSVGFAEALIESYKAELLNEVGEPCDVYLNKDDAESEYTRRNERYPDKTRSLQYLFTSDQLAAAILKATKPLEGEIERLKQQSANRLIGLCKGGEDNDELRAQLAKAEQLWQVAQGRCDGLEEKLTKAEQRVAEACALQVATETRFHWLDAARVAKEIRSGEWRKFLKGE